MRRTITFTVVETLLNELSDFFFFLNRFHCVACLGARGVKTLVTGKKNVLIICTELKESDDNLCTYFPFTCAKTMGKV